MGTSGVPDPLGLSGRTLSHFRVLEELGAGGMGVVYRAQDLRLDRIVALKFMLSDRAGDEATARFLREARSIATLDHSNVCTIYEVGESEEGHLFLAMAYYAGETLKERLRRAGALPLDEALDIAAQIARGLGCAHTAGIVHRDLKPANVMLTSDGTAKILDFGLAKARDQTLTASGVVVGTVAYMSPEQLLGEPIDARSDLYSLGVILYEMVTGEHPSRGDDIGGRLTPSVRRLVERALRRDPAHRFQTAGELLTDLTETRGQLSRVALSANTRRRPRVPLGGRMRMALGAAGLAAIAIGVAWTKLGRSRPAGRQGVFVAVLPFKNYASRDQEYFADGMTDELTTALSKIEGLRVIAHQSVLQFKDSKLPAPEIAKKLDDVAFIIDGAVRQDSSRVSITITVIDPAQNTPKWSRTFQRTRGDVMRLQGDIALAIAGSISVMLTAADQARLAQAHVPPPSAYNLYLQGTTARYTANTDEKMEAAAKFFAEATRIDSAYADAYAGLALIRASMGDERAARALVKKSLELDPASAEAYMARGMIQQYYEWDFSGAEESFREAIEHNPGFLEAHHELAMTLGRVKQHDEALREAREASLRAPESLRFQQGVAEVYLGARKYREAVAIGKQILVDDSTYASANHMLGYAYTALGQWEDALRSWRACLKDDPSGCDLGRARIGYIYARLGRTAEAMAVLDTLEDRFARANPKAQADLATDIANVYSGLRDRAQTLAWLERGRERRAFFMIYLATDPTWDWLRADPRFQMLLERVHLPRT